MRPICAILVLCTFWLASPDAFADQDDPRLDALFVELRDAPSAGAAQPIEARIWNLWMTHEDEAINALMQAGVDEMNQRKFRAALDTFAKMIDLAPDYAEGWNKRATVHWLLGNYRDSLADIEKTLALEPRHFGALSGRGLVYAALEEWDLALEAFEDALAVNPHMRGPRANAEAIRELLKEREI